MTSRQVLASILADPTQRRKMLCEALVLYPLIAVLLIAWPILEALSNG